MDRSYCKLLAGAIALGLASCAGNMGSGSGPEIVGTGPFDSRGNYIEEWADTPSRWNGRSVPTTTPSAPAATSRTLVARNDTPAPVVEVRPTTPSVSPAPQVAAASRPVSQTTPVIASKPKPATPKPAPKPAAKPAPKPTSATHIVKKGDTLYGLAKRYGTTVGAIQKSSNLRTSTIQIGQKLTVPR